jgi:hypothetical protein
VRGAPLPDGICAMQIWVCGLSMKVEQEAKP